MSKYPGVIYQDRTTNLWPSRQYVSTQSMISGGTSGGIASITETWEVGGTGVAGEGNTNPQAGGPATSTLKMYGYTAADMLGYATSKGVGNGIARKLPAQHPELPGLWCSGISNVQGIGANGKTAFSVAAWKIIRFDVTWEQPPYNIFDDATLTTIGDGSEIYRFVIPDYEPSVEFLQRRRGSFRFPRIAGRGGVLTGMAIPDSHGASIRLIKRRYTFRWCFVPDVGLFDGRGFWFGGKATNVEACLGRVNLKTFFNYAPGTLLFEGWKPTPRNFPPLNPGLAIPRAWDVNLTFLEFSPPTDPNDPAQNTFINGNNFGTGGHNAVPHPTNGYWYRAILQDGVGAPLIGPDNNPQYWKFQPVDFATIFKMCA